MDNDTFKLSGEPLKNWLRSTFIPAFGQTESGASMLSTIRELGHKIRTVDFYSIRREVLGIYKNEEQTSNLTSNQLVPHSMIYQEHGLNLNTNYMYRTRVIGINSTTGEEVNTVISWGSNDELTPDEALSAIQAAFASDPKDYGIVISEISLIRVLARPTITL